MEKERTRIGWVFYSSVGYRPCAREGLLTICGVVAIILQFLTINSRGARRAREIHTVYSV